MEAFASKIRWLLSGLILAAWATIRPALGIVLGVRTRGGRWVSQQVWLAAAVFVLALSFAPTLLEASADNYSAYPLQRLDTSSPRATLQNFLEHVEAGIAAQESGDWQTRQAAIELTQQALDFSDTPRGYDYLTQIERVLLLKEVLDRIDPEALGKAPDAVEVERLGIRRWRIPRTSIEIAILDSGDRAGEFLFSAATVADLHRSYRSSKHLPYLSGTAQAVYETWMNAPLANRVRDELRPVEALSPRAVVNQFLLHVNRAYDVRSAVDRAMDQDPPTMSDAELSDAAEEAELHIARAVELLDLSEVPERIREYVGTETALMLKEVLDRAPLPPIAAIPGEQTAALAGADGIRWVQNETGIEIVRLNKGPEVEQYRFSAHTVAQAANFYERVRHLPYRGQSRDAIGRESANEDEYLLGHISPGIWKAYTDSPGIIVPRASWLAPLIQLLPESAKTSYLGQTAWQWALLVMTVVFLLALVYAFARLPKLFPRLVQTWISWLKVLPPTLSAILTLMLVDFLQSQVNLTGWVVVATIVVATIIVYFFAGLATFYLVVALGETLFLRTAAVDPRLENLVLAAARAVGFVIGIAVFIYGVKGVGFDVVPLLAGIGIGGLAVALAIRPTLENIFGGIVLYADQPIHVGDFCTFGDQSGQVERIGLRSTRIRTRNRNVVTVPNSLFADMQITNWAMCDKMQINGLIGVRYETTPDQMRMLLARMRQICFAHPMIETNSLRIRFYDFGGSSLDISVRVYALTRDWSEFYAIREDLYLRFMEALEECGTSIAFPSTTVYLGEDDGLEAEAIARAEAGVARWRENDELPFPLTPEPLATRIVDTLDYPPKGSSGANYERPEPAGQTEEQRRKSQMPGDGV